MTQHWLLGLGLAIGARTRALLHWNTMERISIITQQQQLHKPHLQTSTTNTCPKWLTKNATPSFEMQNEVKKSLASCWIGHFHDGRYFTAKHINTWTQQAQIMWHELTCAGVKHTDRMCDQTLVHNSDMSLLWQELGTEKILLPPTVPTSTVLMKAPKHPPSTVMNWLVSKEYNSIPFPTRVPLSKHHLPSSDTWNTTQWMNHFRHAQIITHLAWRNFGPRSVVASLQSNNRLFLCASETNPDACNVTNSHVKFAKATMNSPVFRHKGQNICWRPLPKLNIFRQ